MSQSGTAVATAFGLQLTVAVLVFFIFSWLRSRRSLRRFYAPKRYDKAREFRPTKLGGGAFGWMTTVYTYPEEEFIKVAGPDSTVYVRVLQFGWEVFFKVTLVTCVLLLPVHLTGSEVDVLLDKQAIAEAAGNLQTHQPFRRLLQHPGRSLLQAQAANSTAGNITASDVPISPPVTVCAPPPVEVEVIKYAYTTFDKLSLVNLPDGSMKFWAHIVCVYIVTYVVLTTLNRFNHKAVQLRMEYLANIPFGGASHSVMITDIPGMRYGTLIWCLQSLVGSRWFFLVPAKYKKQVMEGLETGAEAVAKAHSVDVGVHAEQALRRAATEGQRMRNAVTAAAATAMQRTGRAARSMSVPVSTRRALSSGLSTGTISQAGGGTGSTAGYGTGSTAGDGTGSTGNAVYAHSQSLPNPHIRMGVNDARSDAQFLQANTVPPSSDPSVSDPSPHSHLDPNPNPTRLTAANISINTMLTALAENGSALVTQDAEGRVANASSSPFSKAAGKDRSENDHVVVDVPLDGCGAVRNRRPRRSELVATPEALSPWQQAYKAFGKHFNPPVDQVERFIHTELERAYGRNTIAAVNMVAQQRSLDPLFNEYKGVKQQLEDYLDHVVYQLKSEKPITKRRTVTVLGPALGAWGIKRYGMKAAEVDAIEHWVARLEHLCTVIPEAQKVAKSHAIPAAFVTVNTRATQVAMSNSLHHHDETTWQLQAAPEPKELIWGSLTMRRWEREVRTVFMWGIYFVLMVTFMIPVTIVQNYLQIGVQTVTAPFAAQVLQGIIPGLTLVLFLVILPYILIVMCRLSGFVSISAIDFGVVNRYFFFQVVGLFLGSVVATSLWDQVKQFATDPGSLVSILGEGLPSSASFFVNWVLVVGVGKTGIKHLRLAELAIYLVALKAASTRRARERLWLQQYIWFGHTVPDFTIFFLLGMVYCCLNPIITPAVLLFYTFTIMSKRYNMLYVYTPKYETGGKLWAHVFHQFVVGLYFMQVVMIVVLSQRGFKMGVLIIPALILTIWFHISTVRLYRRPMNAMAAHDAAVLDELDKKDRGTSEVGPLETKRIQELYQSPALQFKPDDVRGLMREARIVAAALALPDGAAAAMLDEQLSRYTGDDTADCGSDRDGVDDDRGTNDISIANEPSLVNDAALGKVASKWLEAVHEGEGDGEDEKEGSGSTCGSDEKGQGKGSESGRHLGGAGSGESVAVVILQPKP